jgi:hypothetical protein
VETGVTSWDSYSACRPLVVIDAVSRVPSGSAKETNVHFARLETKQMYVYSAFAYLSSKLKRWGYGKCCVRLRYACFKDTITCHDVHIPHLSVTHVRDNIHTLRNMATSWQRISKDLRIHKVVWALSRQPYGLLSSPGCQLADAKLQGLSLVLCISAVGKFLHACIPGYCVNDRPVSSVSPKSMDTQYRVQGNGMLEP